MYDQGNKLREMPYLLVKKASRISADKKLVLLFNFPLKLLFVYLLMFSNCKSYQSIPNGYVVRGDESFVNVDEKLIVYLGPSFLANQYWQLGDPPVNSLKLTTNRKNILKKLGYNKNGYASLFQSSTKLPHELFVIINTQPVSTSPKGLLHQGNLKRKITKNGKWFYEILEWNNKQIYHAVIPISVNSFAEKKLSLIYTADENETNFDIIENIIERNATMYATSNFYVPSKTVIQCQNETDGKYYDYKIPDNNLNDKDYMLLKVFTDDQERELIYYTLLSPGQRMGAFKICRGKYNIQYTTLENNVHWDQQLIIE